MGCSPKIFSLFHNILSFSSSSLQADCPSITIWWTWCIHVPSISNMLLRRSRLLLTPSYFKLQHSIETTATANTVSQRQVGSGSDSRAQIIIWMRRRQRSWSGRRWHTNHYHSHPQRVGVGDWSKKTRIVWLLPKILSSFPNIFSSFIIVAC